MKQNLFFLSFLLFFILLPLSACDEIKDEQGQGYADIGDTFGTGDGSLEYCQQYLIPLAKQNAVASLARHLLNTCHQKDPYALIANPKTISYSNVSCQMGPIDYGCSVFTLFKYFCSGDPDKEIRDVESDFVDAVGASFNLCTYKAEVASVAAAQALASRDCSRFGLNIVVPVFYLGGGNGNLDIEPGPGQTPSYYATAEATRTADCIVPTP